MPYQPFPPYQQNPYGQPQYGNYQPYQQNQPQNTYAFVNGVEGAKSYPMAPNQTVMLMDSDNPIAYMKQSNAMGQATLKYFRLVETSESELKGTQQRPQGDFVLKSDFDALRKKVDEILSTKKVTEDGEPVQRP